LDASDLVGEHQRAGGQWRTHSAATKAMPSPRGRLEWSAKYWQWRLGQSTNKEEMVGWSGASTGPASLVRFLNQVDIPSTGGITRKTNKVIPARLNY
jgi:hypothetical protein